MFILILKEFGINGPVFSLVKDVDKAKTGIDPNNLPYLHRNPAVWFFFVSKLLLIILI